MRTNRAKFTVPLSCSCLFFSRWEVPIDGVMLDGQQFPASALPGSGTAISAVIDTVITSLRTSDRILMLTPIVGERSNPGTEGCCRHRLEAGLTCIRCRPQCGTDVALCSTTRTRVSDRRQDLSHRPPRLHVTIYAPRRENMHC